MGGSIVNVRELGHAIENAVLMTDGDRIDIGDLACHQDATVEAIDMPASGIPASDLPTGVIGTAKDWPYSLEAVVREASKLALIRVLQASRGNCHRAAELLGVSRYTVYRMLNRFGLGEGLTYRTFRKPNEV